MSEEQVKTIYRIITLRTFIADRYLQFKSTTSVRSFPKFWVKREIECWRFIPQDTYAYVFGLCLNQSSCPIKLPFMGESHFLHCFYKQVRSLQSFARRFPDIQKYFDDLQKKREEYLEEEREKNSAEATEEIIEISN